MFVLLSWRAMLADLLAAFVIALCALLISIGPHAAFVLWRLVSAR